MEAAKTLDHGLDILDIEADGKLLIPQKIHSDIPYVRVGERGVCFNMAAAQYINSSRLLVSKATEHIIFTPTNSSCGYSVKKSLGGNICFGCRQVIQSTGLIPGAYYKLYRVKSGGYAIKRYEPIDWGAEI